jgi:hypothetical protein
MVNKSYSMTDRTYYIKIGLINLLTNILPAISHVSVEFRYLLRHPGRCSEGPYVAGIYTGPSSRCLILLAYFVAGGQIQSVLSPFRL